MSLPLNRPVRLADFAVDPYPLFAQLRETQPVAWAEDANMWLLTRREDVIQVLRDCDTFRTDSPRSTIHDTFGSQMLSVEGDRHRRYKSQCGGPFNARAIRDHAVPMITSRTRALIDACASQSRVELRGALASPLAIYTVAAVLGIPESLHGLIRKWYDDFAAALANFTWDEAVRERGQTSVRQFRESIAPIIRSAAGEETLLAVLARRSADRLSDDEILANALIVLFGGIETTESTLLNVFWTLLRHPEALATVRHDRSLLPGAIEEAMRWEPAVQSCTRHVSARVAMHGTTINAGDVVQCMLGAANRDPTYFAEPDRYDISRPNAGDHLSFGSGRHYCLGAALARAEVSVAVNALIDRFPTLRADPERPSAPQGFEFRAPPTLWVLPHP
jgi:cytochrome P450